ncbi:hypothetical protein [Streptomyces sp. NBC_00986]|uniref:hypothetical protein n=1 Tax=Streptomyces sp. NBC_00986 TaxID=2903702 RepID=UPI00386BDD8A|nr:hypothetical protein OG504_01870 [Streptomyces sp. NBC_00986]
MRELADWPSIPSPRLEPVATAEQYIYALSTFDTARIYGNQDEPGVAPCLDDFRRRTVVTLDNEKPNSWFAGYVRLRAELGDLWPLPERLTLSLDRS